MDARRARDVVAIASVFGIACVAVRALGFDHVSDDDFARVTIAQSFAHDPGLDPSGTSWLPFPFWITGGAMMITGRSLAAARAISVVIASLAATLPYLALRRREPRGPALIAALFALLAPWSVWLGAATVPESFTATAITAGALVLGAAPSKTDTRARDLLPGAALVMTACLSRYEAWPIAAVLAITIGLRGSGPNATDTARRALGIALVCAAGPLLWMAWNAHAHDGPLHFFRRVSNFKRAIGEGTTSDLDALLLYPRLLATTRPDVLFATAFALPSLRRPEIRDRWLVPLLAALASFAFLAYGNVRDGAPAHHPERALLEITMILALFAASVLAEVVVASAGRARTVAFAATGVIAIAWLLVQRPLLHPPPGTSPSEDRSAQIARGLALRDARSVTVEPCAFEHFALIAAFGSPERVQVLPRTGGLVDAACPRVVSR